MKTSPKEHRLQTVAHRFGLKIVLDRYSASATGRKEYRPGEMVGADVAVTDRDGHAAKAAVTFYAVDEGVLMLTSYQTPDPLPPFTADQRLAVFSVERSTTINSFRGLIHPVLAFGIP